MTIEGYLNRRSIPIEGTSAAHLAEIGLVGALINDPAATGEVADWLEQADFHDLFVGSVYATLRQLHHSGRIPPPDPNLAGTPTEPRTATESPLRMFMATLVEAWRDSDYHGLRLRPAPPPGADPKLPPPPRPPTGLELLALVELMSACPRAPQPRLYAEAVLQASIRRRLHQLGVRIRQHANLADVDDRGTESVADTATRLWRVMRDGERAVRRDQRRLDEQGRSGPAAAPEPIIPEPIVPGRQVPAWEQQHTAAAERRLIGTCIANTAVRETALHALRVADFSDPAARNGWTVLTSFRGSPAGEIEFALAAEPTVTAPTVLQWVRVGAELGYEAISDVAHAALHRLTTQVGEGLQQMVGRDAPMGFDMASPIAPTGTRQLLADAAAALQRARTATHRLARASVEGPAGQRPTYVGLAQLVETALKQVDPDGALRARVHQQPDSHARLLDVLYAARTQGQTYPQLGRRLRDAITAVGANAHSRTDLAAELARALTPPATPTNPPTATPATPVPQQRAAPAQPGRSAAASSLAGTPAARGHHGRPPAARAGGGQ